ncbi:MAG TPA: beta-eliminating lyase-related protein [Oligoflexia bacterium]|nr:beta-eliminating lyase-related protein [Oligoflexia bacterium]HMR24282.1 beta-eliminating lyase-related protein [Oligoflexia bacterium]
MNQNEILKIKNNCQFFLHGHYPLKPKQYFEEMYEHTSPNEEADRYGEGEALQAFEHELKNIFGFEDCVFLQSGTMAQLIAMRIWTDLEKNSRIAFHPTCHLELHEQHAYKKLHGLSAELIGHKDQLMNIEDLKNLKEIPAAVIIELPQREIGGQLPSWEDLKKQISYLRSKNIKVHLDGARVWECAPYYQKTYQEITSLFDSVYISFYKGIGAIAGAALLGSSIFIKKARVWNRRHGGNLITAAPLYLSARYNLKKRIHSFESFYKKTKEICAVIATMEGISINPKIPQVNMFHLMIKGDSNDLSKRVLEVAKEMGIWGFSNIKPSPVPEFSTLEWYVGDAALDIPLEKIKQYISRVLDR